MHSRLHKLFTAVFVLVASMFFFNLLGTGFNEGDDVVNLHYVLSHSYKQLLHTPFMDDQNAIMFRPGLAIIQKSLQVFSESHWLMLRLFQAGFASLFFWMFYRVLKGKISHPLPLFTALFYLLSSPFLFAPFVTYGYVGALTLLPMLCLTLIALNREKESVYWNILGFVICLIAPYIQEFGLLLIPLWMAYFIKQKKRVIPICLALLLPPFFIIRHYVLGPGLPPGVFSHNSGFGTKMLSAEEIGHLFSGPKAYFFYVYNLIAQAGNLFFSQPNYGYFSLKPFPLLKLYRLILITASSAVIMVYTVKTWKKPHPFLKWAWIIIVLNLPLTYFYARPRILVFASVGYALLLAISADALWQEKTKQARYLSMALLIGWVIHTAEPILHVAHDKQFIHTWYTTRPEPLRGSLSTYKAIQKHHVHDSAR